MFPELHKRLRENSIFYGTGEANMKDRVLNPKKENYINLKEK